MKWGYICQKLWQIYIQKFKNPHKAADWNESASVTPPWENQVNTSFLG